MASSCSLTFSFASKDIFVMITIMWFLNNPYCYTQSDNVSFPPSEMTSVSQSSSTLQLERDPTEYLEFEDQLGVISKTLEKTIKGEINTAEPFFR